MTAISAANALMTYDADLRARVDEYFGGREPYAIPSEESDALLREIAGTWTLGLAAASAGVTERQVLVALARHYLHLGTLKAAISRVYFALDQRAVDPYVPTPEEQAESDRVEQSLDATRAQVRAMLARVPRN